MRETARARSVGSAETINIGIARRLLQRIDAHAARADRVVEMLDGRILSPN
ncbi:hypothetical protein D779_3640 [Imhoffiella purpurea]|uniref:Uncharacterized protein n=1 Tax=Imhoffiella purpurea TaxID=1249627 RepID=W9V9J1_9GAMM|nr:hypothetical protein D779_3640 [Imhoffiella purpurea]